MMKISLLFGCIIPYLICSVDSQCNVCLLPASVACVSETEFQPCFSDGTKGPVTSCPLGTVCTADASICVASTGASAACVPACGNCGIMNIACLNLRYFAYCFGQNTPSNVIGICPSGMVCRNSAPEFCVNPLVASADCQETTTVAPTTWNGLCSGPGNFPIPGTTDCKQYIHCFYSYNVLRVQIYTCQGNTIFYPATQLCMVPSAAFNCG